MNTISNSWNGSSWDTTGRQLFTYDINNNRTNTLSQGWNNSIWINSSQSLYTYDASNNQTSYTHQTWVGNVWKNQYWYQFTFDADNNMLSEIWQQWYVNNWINIDSLRYYYGSVAGIIGVDKTSKIILSPNPATTQFSVSSRHGIIKEIEIYDVLGQKVFSEQLSTDNYQLTVDVSKWNSGMYFVKVRGEKIEAVVKLVKE